MGHLAQRAGPDPRFRALLHETCRDARSRAAGERARLRKSVIRVQDLVRQFGALRAVGGISFRVEEGEIVGFLGLNGAGKTTTLRMLTGYLPASSGLIEIAGYDVLRDSLEVRRRIGYLPEAVPLYREHRLSEMLEFQARLHGLERRHARTRIGEVLEQVGLADRARTLIGELSKGMRQRAGLAVALLPDPEVLVLDEPTSGLDPLQRIEVRGLVRELASKRTVLFSSHILPEVEAICPRVLILHKGRVLADGTPAELARRLGGDSYLRCEAFVGPDAAAAQRLLAGLPGVLGVHSEGRLGVHEVFRLRCDEDLREDVGALAAQRGWALRELSFARPALEDVFARIALELDARAPSGAATAASTSTHLGADAPRGAQASPASDLLVLSAPRAASSAPTPAPAATPAKSASSTRVVYNLNPFDQGATRDLGRPKAVDAPEGSSAKPPPAAP